jgi:transglutaminase-like putative cysteine protease
MKLPFDVDDSDGVPGDAAAIDHSGVDWSRVRRSSYAIHQRITYLYDGPVHRLHQRLMVQPREHHGDQRRISRHVRVVDAEPRQVRSRNDDFGNHVIDVEVPYVAEKISFISWSVVERRSDHPHLAAASALADRRLLEPTRLTEPDDSLRALAEEMRATCLLGEELAVAACRRVFELMTYAHDVTGVRTTAAQAFALRTGVCQDYAHVLLAIARCLGFPARYVSGQMLGVGGSHAWVEVLVPDDGGRHARVISLDPTHGRRTDMTYLTIAVGRDYAHVAPVSGSYRAPASGVLTISKRVAVMRIDADGLTDVQASLDSQQLAG